ncbi:hypothetical protein SSX86_000992 [Deinandra increscens subsp. villosa]|uniref:HSF-type DNA-binding domain-containing protein n=1 Tax=Deinandra increscens subsp. villosa TaxID=3103831 RepID=A0AAP0HC48_9ASTR
MDPSWTSFGSHPLTPEDAEDVGVPKPLDCLQGAPIPPPFLSKTFDMVDDSRLDQIISWSKSGASFIVWDPVEFARRILPKNFKHNNFSSFVRQLNTYVRILYLSQISIFCFVLFCIVHLCKLRFHCKFCLNFDSFSTCIFSQCNQVFFTLISGGLGFRKIDTDRWEFACESFLRGKRHLLKNIRRRRSLPAQQLTEESSSLSVEAEVDRLQKEKIEMMQEVIDLQNQQQGTHQYIEAVNQKLQAAEDRQKQMVSSLAKVFQIQKFKKDQCRLSSRQTVRKFIKHQPNLDIESETVPLELHDLNVQELAQIKDPFPKEELDELDVNLDYVGTTMIKQEDIWSSEFETVSAMPNWNDAGNYEYPEFGVPGGELSDFWNLADSGAEFWMSGETSQSAKTNQYGF